MSRRRPRRSLLVSGTLSTGIILMSCASGGPSDDAASGRDGAPIPRASTHAEGPGAEAVDTTAVDGILNVARPIDGVLTGGQPDREQLAAAIRAGYTTVVSLRTAAETGHDWEPAAVADLAGRFEALPIDGMGGLDRTAAERLDGILDAADGGVFVHCASSNRVGALFALREGWLRDASIKDAVSVGRAAGMTNPTLVSHVEALLRDTPPSTRGGDANGAES